jgi:hypothetical protein
MMFPEAVEYLRGAPLLRRQAQMAPRRTTQRDRAPTSHSYLRCWDQGIDPANTIVEQYLNNRGGLTVPESAPIRFHPRCQRGPSDLPGGPEFWPAMLALMTDAVTGQPVGLHRTFLRPDGSGKAPQTTRGGFVLKPKMILGNWGVIRLTPDDLIGRGLGSQRASRTRSRHRRSSGGAQFGLRVPEENFRPSLFSLGSIRSRCLPMPTTVALG